MLCKCSDKAFWIPASTCAIISLFLAPAISLPAPSSDPRSVLCTMHRAHQTRRGMSWVGEAWRAFPGGPNRTCQGDGDREVSEECRWSTHNTQTHLDVV